jgi:MOSC domain-containing protein YiiM
MTEPRLEIVSIQVGLPQQLGQAGAEDPLDRPWVSAIYKRPVTGKVWLGSGGLWGDGQADLRHHGGPDRALLGYSAEHYALWVEELGRTDLVPGTFGENLTIAGLTEKKVCVGDRFSAGDTVIEATQPRQPCYNLARKLHVPDMVKRVKAWGRGGWYLRLIREGWLESGMPLRLVDNPYPEWTIREAARVYQERERDPARAARLAECQALSSDWREKLASSGS